LQRLELAAGMALHGLLYWMGPTLGHDASPRRFSDCRRNARRRGWFRWR
jgi:hypothetical protein